ncbi:lipoprotein 17-related variable surface protein [Mycoplasmopsis gallinarum]|uniref:1-phosphatidylinositol phosphodiesterase n=1 Tax=Mycoplasmopsis gallinarum TaxID=29557 RepID=A0A168RDN4_9BACT|nr:lipoprotein 17-related variable surface protein [Mycoplasmopsis gallinarum]OAB48875.1 hypothetical protein MGALLINA_03780 [Mycoplasmopsis gallinarum]
MSKKIKTLLTLSSIIFPLTTIISVSTIPSQSVPENDLNQASSVDVTDTRLQFNDWMKYVDGNKRLTDLSIPGTHDAAMFDGSGFAWKFGGKAWAKTQSRNIATQLKSGIRFFDIRISNNMWIYHGAAASSLSFDAFLNEIKNFLKRYPSETVIMRYKDENANIQRMSDQDRAKWRAKIYAAFLKDGIRDIVYQNETNEWFTNPTLNELRGKLYVMDNMHHLILEHNKDFGTIWNPGVHIIQDQYETDENVKLNLVKEFLNISNNDDEDKDRLIVNFTSRSKGGSQPHATARPINKNILEYLNNNQQILRTGIIVFDFPGDSLLKRIIKTNYVYTQRELNREDIHPHVSLSLRTPTEGNNFIEYSGDATDFNFKLNIKDENGQVNQILTGTIDSNAGKIIFDYEFSKNENVELNYFKRTEPNQYYTIPQLYNTGSEEFRVNPDLTIDRLFDLLVAKINEEINYLNNFTNLSVYQNTLDYFTNLKVEITKLKTERKAPISITKEKLTNWGEEFNSNKTKINLALEKLKNLLDIINKLNPIITTENQNLLNQILEAKLNEYLNQKDSNDLDTFNNNFDTRLISKLNTVFDLQSDINTYNNQFLETNWILFDNKKWAFDFYLKQIETYKNNCNNSLNIKLTNYLNSQITINTDNLEEINNQILDFYNDKKIKINSFNSAIVNATYLKDAQKNSFENDFIATFKLEDIDFSKWNQLINKVNELNNLTKKANEIIANDSSYKQEEEYHWSTEELKEQYLNNLQKIQNYFISSKVEYLSANLKDWIDLDGTIKKKIQKYFEKIVTEKNNKIQAISQMEYLLDFQKNNYKNEVNNTFILERISSIFDIAVQKNLQNSEDFKTIQKKEYLNNVQKTALLNDLKTSENDKNYQNKLRDILTFDLEIKDKKTNLNFYENYLQESNYIYSATELKNAYNQALNSIKRLLIDNENNFTLNDLMTTWEQLIQASNNLNGNDNFESAKNDLVEKLRTNFYNNLRQNQNTSLLNKAEALENFDNLKTLQRLIVDLNLKMLQINELLSESTSVKAENDFIYATKQNQNAYNEVIIETQNNLNQNVILDTNEIQNSITSIILVKNSLNGTNRYNQELEHLNNQNLNISFRDDVNLIKSADEIQLSDLIIESIPNMQVLNLNISSFNLNDGTLEISYQLESNLENLNNLRSNEKVQNLQALSEIQRLEYLINTPNNISFDYPNKENILVTNVNKEQIIKNTSNLNQAKVVIDSLSFIDENDKSLIINYYLQSTKNNLFKTNIKQEILSGFASIYDLKQKEIDNFATSNLIFNANSSLLPSYLAQNLNLINLRTNQNDYVLKIKEILAFNDLEGKLKIKYQIQSQVKERLLVSKDYEIELTGYLTELNRINNLLASLTDVNLSFNFEKNHYLASEQIDKNSYQLNPNIQTENVALQINTINSNDALGINTLNLNLTSTRKKNQLIYNYDSQNLVAIQSNNKNVNIEGFITTENNIKEKRSQEKARLNAINLNFDVNDKSNLLASEISQKRVIQTSNLDNETNYEIVNLTNVDDIEGQIDVEYYVTSAKNGVYQDLKSDLKTFRINGFLTEKNRLNELLKIQIPSVSLIGINKENYQNFLPSEVFDRLEYRFDNSTAKLSIESLSYDDLIGQIHIDYKLKSLRNNLENVVSSLNNNLTIDGFETKAKRREKELNLLTIEDLKTQYGFNLTYNNKDRTLASNVKANDSNWIKEISNLEISDFQIVNFDDINGILNVKFRLIDHQNDYEAISDYKSMELILFMTESQRLNNLLTSQEINKTINFVYDNPNNLWLSILENQKEGLLNNLENQYFNFAITNENENQAKIKLLDIQFDENLAALNLIYTLISTRDNLTNISATQKQNYLIKNFKTNWTEKTKEAINNLKFLQKVNGIDEQKYNEYIETFEQIDSKTKYETQDEILAEIEKLLANYRVQQKQEELRNAWENAKNAINNYVVEGLIQIKNNLISVTDAVANNLNSDDLEILEQSIQDLNSIMLDSAQIKLQWDTLIAEIKHLININSTEILNYSYELNDVYTLWNTKTNVDLNTLNVTKLNIFKDEINQIIVAFNKQKSQLLEEKNAILTSNSEIIDSLKLNKNQKNVLKNRTNIETHLDDLKLYQTFIIEYQKTLNSFVKNHLNAKQFEIANKQIQNITNMNELNDFQTENIELNNEMGILNQTLNTIEQNIQNNKKLQEKFSNLKNELQIDDLDTSEEVKLANQKLNEFLKNENVKNSKSRNWIPITLGSIFGTLGLTATAGSFGFFKWIKYKKLKK